MAASIKDILDWISGQQPRMVRRVVEWAEINSYSFNVAGLKNLSGVIERDFRCWEGRFGGTICRRRHFWIRGRRW